MPIDTDSVGASGEPRPLEIDARWTMAFAAGIGDTSPAYLDTLQPGGVVAHPLFPVCFEWPVFLDSHRLRGNERLAADELRRGVHATHELVLHRPIRPGDRLWTRATIAGVERRRPGAYQIVRLDTAGPDGEPVSTTWYGTIYRGVEVVGEDRPATDLPPPPRSEPAGVPVVSRIPIAADAAHVYSECARIWNPIHTDPSIARRAGLPGIILHGTATLALAVSRVAPGAAVSRISARFEAMVRVPSEIALAVYPRADAAAETRFAVRTRDGELAIRDGMVGEGALGEAPSA